MSLRLAVAASLVDVSVPVKYDNTSAKRKYASAPTNGSAKRHRWNESQCKKRRCDEALPGHDAKVPRLATDINPQTSGGDRVVARHARVQAAFDYTRTNLLQKDYNCLYPLEIEDNISDDVGVVDKRPRS